MRQFIGIVFISLGGLLLLSLLGILDFSLGQLISDFWPSILILLGINHISEHRSSSTWGYILIAAGAILIGRNLGFIPFGFWEILWPTVLVIAGFLILKNPAKNRSNIKHDSTTIRINTILGGAKENYSIDDFHGGEINSILGGAEIDIRDCNINSQAQIDVNCVLGGIKLRIDRNTNLIINGTPILGALENKTRGSEILNAPTLIINYSVILGGIEITD